MTKRKNWGWSEILNLTEFCFGTMSINYSHSFSLILYTSIFVKISIQLMIFYKRIIKHALFLVIFQLFIIQEACLLYPLTVAKYFRYSTFPDDWGPIKTFILFTSNATSFIALIFLIVSFGITLFLRQVNIQNTYYNSLIKTFIVKVSSISLLF